MKICINYTAKEQCLTRHTNLLTGCLSYVGHGESLFFEKQSICKSDVMIAAIKDATEDICRPIYDECRRHGFRYVFLDAESQNPALPLICDFLSRQKLTVFLPLDLAASCPDSIPVAEGGVSGGTFSEYIERLISRHKPLALSLPRSFLSFEMGKRDTCGIEITKKEVLRLSSLYDAEIFYSPQLMTNYFIYSHSKNQASYVLFDDARSINEKIRLAKKLGVSHVFLTYSEISDIISDITF